tara:strand:- start:1426 stop:1806 length:381 start_codon:yes stop_codon:yes gene_type:complete
MDGLDPDTIGCIWDKCSLAICFTCKNAYMLYENMYQKAAIMFKGWYMITNLSKRFQTKRTQKQEEQAEQMKIKDKFYEQFKFLILPRKYLNYPFQHSTPHMPYVYDTGMAIRMRRHSDEESERKYN